MFSVEKATESRQVIVLGMHRSGTSATTALIKSLGAFTGSDEELTSPSAQNPRGFFERRDIRRICNALLHSAGADWWKISDFDVSGVPPQFASKKGAEIANILAELDRHGTWVVKEPRLCLLFPLFRKYLHSPAVVFVARNPLEVANSLRRRNGFSRHVSLALWEVYCIAALRYSADLPRTIILHDDVLNDPFRAAEKLYQSLTGLGVRDLHLPSTHVIDPTLHRERCSDVEFSAVATEEQKRLWLAIKSGDSRTEFPLAASSSARAVLQDFQDDHHRHVMQISVLEDRAKQLEASVQAAELHVAAERQRTASLEHQVSGMAKQLSDAEVALTRYQTEIKGYASDMREAKARIASLESKLDRVRYGGALRSTIRLGRLLPSKNRRKRAKKPREDEIEIIRNSGLFDATWYLNRYPDVTLSRLDPIYHYVCHGSAEGRDPNPRFDTTRYLIEHKDIRDQGINPFAHYILNELTQGEPANEQGKATAKLAEYAAKLVTSIQVNRDDSTAIQEQNDRALIEASGLFDAGWYLNEYADVASKKADPALHFVRCGWRERRNPGPSFNTGWYLDQYGNVLTKGVNPLVHYIQIGQHEGHQAVPPKGHAHLWWANIKPQLGSRWKTAEQPVFNVAAAMARARYNSAPPAILVPIYNAPECVKDCVDSILRHTGIPHRLILINDSSPDSKVDEVLSKYARETTIEVYRNDQNLGFAWTVNRGIDIAGRSDVIILNSDTKVTPYWLENLRLAAYSGDNVATATPLSNNAGAFSTPLPNEPNALPDFLTLDGYARLVTEASGRIYPETPTGNGFCMYVRRDCIDNVGRLDAIAFPRGYGEENDFCMRAVRHGWTHVVDDATLIYHVRAASFGETKWDLMKHGRSVVDQRYPDYSRLAKDFLASSKMREVRNRLKEAVKLAESEPRDLKPRVLYVVSTRTGGTPQTNEDLMSGLSDHVATFLLRSDAREITLSVVCNGKDQLLETASLTEVVEPTAHLSKEYDEIVASWLVYYAIDLVHIRHIAWHSRSLVRICKEQGVKAVFSFHDFYTICPTVKLLDDKLTYCGGVCTAGGGQCKHELWPQALPPLKGQWIRTWQAMMSDMLAQCDAFVTTSKTTYEQLLFTFKWLPFRRFEIIPHGRDFSEFARVGHVPAHNEEVKVLLPGNISEAKGANLVRQIAELDTEGRFQFHILGDCEPFLKNVPNVVTHGRYKREQFVDIVRSINPHIGAIFSIWPETYCHALTELWVCGLPVIGLDFGAVGERIRATSGGWIVPTTDAASLHGAMRKIVADHRDLTVKIEALGAIQADMQRGQSIEKMAARYWELYKDLGLSREPWHRRPTPTEIVRPMSAIQE